MTLWMLLALNAIVFISLHVIWSKSDMLNAVIKIVFLILGITNGFQAYQLSEAARAKAYAETHTGASK